MKNLTKWLVAAGAAVALSAFAGSRPAGAADVSPERWERCWETASGLCRYKCTASDPDECPCETSGECEVSET